MTMKRSLVILTTLSFFGCGLFSHRVKDVVYPKEQNGLKVSYVKIKSRGDFSDLYKISRNDLPIWCSMGELKKKHISVLGEYLNAGKKGSQTYVACYSGQKPVVEETAEQPDSFLKLEKGRFFMYDPLQEFYVLGVTLDTSCPQAMLVYYFTMYSELCSSEEMECCMNGSDGVFNVYALIRAASSEDAASRISGFLHYLEHPQLARSTQVNSLDLFNTNIQDKCSFNRLFHGAVNMGIEKPELLLEKEGWDHEFDSLKSCRIRIKDKALIFAGQEAPGTLDGILP